MKLADLFYTSENVLDITRHLLGKFLFTCIDCLTTGGYIVEAEAYNGIADRASHAYGNRRTKRTETMFAPGGLAYIYLCYGIHEMLNVVTGPAGVPQAILIRAIEPTDGIDIMLHRRGMEKLHSRMTSGPGSLTKALGVNRNFNGVSLQSNSLWIEDRGVTFRNDEIACVPRVGVDYAGTDALLPYRLYVKGNIYVSKPNK